MKLWEISVRKPVFAWMFMICLVVFGLLAYQRLGISLLPDADMPVVNVSFDWPGAAPEIVEVDVIDLVEAQLSSISGVKKITSTARRGNAAISVEFDRSKNIDTAVSEVQNKLLQAQRNLPNDLSPAVISKINQEDRPILWLAVKTKTIAPRDLMIYVRDQLLDQFQTVEGVADITIGGYTGPNLRVYPDLNKLNQQDLTALDLADSIAQEHRELPAGTLKEAQREYVVRAEGEAQSVEEFSQLQLLRRGGSINFAPIPLNAVSTVEKGLDDVQRISRANGETALGLGIRKQRGVNTLDLINRIKIKMERLKTILPKGVELTVNYDSSRFIQESYDELKFTIYLSCLLTALCVFLFLRQWTPTLNIILSIPTVLFGTFWAMQALGLTLNTSTMLALTCAIGMVVDDNIMVLENIERWYQKLGNWAQAAIDGTGEIFQAVLATSLAVIAIFFPIAFASGELASFLIPFALCIIIAIAISTLDALILTPMRAAQMSPRTLQERTQQQHREQLPTRYGIWFRGLLDFSLKSPWKVLVVGIMVFGLSLYLGKIIPKTMLPTQDQSSLFLSIKTPVGSSLEFTDETTKRVEKILLKQPQILRYFLSVGGFQAAESNSAFSFITLKPKEERSPLPGETEPPTQQQLATYLREQLTEQIPEAIYTVQDPGQQGRSRGRGQGANIEFKISGPEWSVLTQLSDRAKEVLKQSGQVEDVDGSFKGYVTELSLRPDRLKAKQRGVSTQEIVRTVQLSFAGLVAGKISLQGHRFDIRVKLTDRDLANPKIFEQIYVRNNRGERIPLSEVCIIEKRPGMISTTREDRQRSLSVFGQANEKTDLPKLVKALQEKLTPLMPAGYSVQPAGASQEQQETSKELLIIFLLGILVSYMVLGAQFNSFALPVIILLALPFSITGGLLFLWMFNQTLNMYSAIGFVLLAGIVKKNSIMIVEFCEQLRTQQGMGALEAIKMATTLRLRPIIMTSLTSLVGALPAALALGPGAEARIPLALTIIGGLIISTILSLFVIPSALVIFYRLRLRKSSLR